MKWEFISLILVVFTFFFAVPIASGQTFRTGDNPILGSQEVINADYFATGETVTVQGTINGDAYVAGGNINIAGTINGDLLAAGGNINVTGTVTGNIRTAGGAILLNGRTGRNLTAVGGNINIAPESRIEGSAALAGGNISLLGPIVRGLTVGGGQVTIGNQVGGDITAGVGKLNVSPQARVNGNLTYWSESAAEVSPEASVSGRIAHNIPPRKGPSAEEARRNAAGVLTFFKILSFISALIAGALLLWLVPNYVQRTTQIITNRPLLSLGIGFLTLAITPVVFLVLLITLVGIPFALLWLFSLFFDMWLAKIFISVIIGVWVMKFLNQKVPIYAALVVGLIIYYMISSIPIIGWLIGFITALTGLGAMMIAKKNIYRELRKKAII